MNTPTFNQWLRSQRLAATTARSYGLAARRFAEWLADQQIKPSQLAYTDLLEYIRSLKARGLSARSINNYVSGIRWWTAFLTHQGILAENPATGLYIRGIRKRLPQDLLEPQKLERLYAEHEPRWTEGHRNKAILGLWVFQGLLATELERLELDHLDLQAGTIRIPPGKLGAGRTLELKAAQILDLHRYVSEVRPKLLQEQPAPTPKLLLSGAGSPRLHNATKLLRRQLRKRYSWFTGAGQLRASRIALWVSTCNLREAQYRAGHRQVSTTERYKMSDLEGLAEAVGKHHPLG